MGVSGSEALAIYTTPKYLPTWEGQALATRCTACDGHETRYKIINDAALCRWLNLLKEFQERS